MPGGGKGPSSSGNITQTTVNPTQQAQLPFLTGQAGNAIGNPNLGWNQAVNLATTGLRYYPNQTLADFNPAISRGYNDIAGSIPGVYDVLANPANNAFNSAVSGGNSIYNSPAYSMLAGIGYSGNRADNFLYPLAGIGSTSQSNAGNIGGLINPLAAYASPFAQGVANSIGGAGNTAQSYGDYYGNQLSGLAGGINSGISDPAAALWNNASWAANGGGARNALTAAANGAFLNKNPYIDRQYQAASDPVVRQYMTATAPQTDSNLEAAGRYGSGALANRRSQNELNLGQTLGDLAANLYGQDYANERNLMTQAGQAVEQNFLQGVNASNTAASALGNLRLSAAGLGGNLLQNAGQLGISGAGTNANALASAGNLGLSGIGAGIAGYGAGNSATNADLSTALNAMNAGGNLSISGLSPALSALGALQSGYDTGNRSALQALALEPSVISSYFSPAQAGIAAGQGLTGLDQAKIADAMQRFYGEQDMPWTNLTRYMNAIGQPTDGSRSVTTPVLGPSPLSSGLGLLGGLNSAFGNGGFASGLFGGGLGLSNSALGSLGGTAAIGGGLGDVGTAGGFFGPTLAEAGGSLGGGKGLGSILPFTLF